MSLIHLTSLANFNDALYEMLKKIEKPHDVPKLIGAEKHVTIGLGFDLNSGGTIVQKAVFRVLGLDVDRQRAGSDQQKMAEADFIIKLSAAINEKNISKLHSIMAERATRVRTEGDILFGWIPESELHNKFEFWDKDGKNGTDNEIRTAFDNALEYYQGKVSQALFGYSQTGKEKWKTFKGSNGSPLATSCEFQSLLSLAWNGGSGIIGPNLKNAIISGNRVEAWYEIRYKSNKLGWAHINNTATGNQISEIAEGYDKGFAKRRFYESEVFSLYESGDQAKDKAEALQVYQMYSEHRNNMLQYEATYGKIYGREGSRNDQIAKANSDYSLYISPTNFVENLSDELHSSAEILMLEYIKTEWGRTSDFNPLNIQATSTNNPTLYGEDTTTRTGSNEDLLIGRDLPGYLGVDSLFGGDGNDMLIGQDGNDYLVGGKDADILVGGKGLDTYVWNPGDGNDRIIEEREADGKIHAIIQINNDGLSWQQLVVGGFLRDGTSNIWTMKASDGSVITLTHNSPWKLVLADGNTLELGDFQDGDFGINLLEKPPTGESDHTFVGGNGFDTNGWGIDQDNPGHYLYSFGDINNVGDWEKISVSPTTTLTIYGGEGSDNFYGLPGHDHLIGGAGNDYLLSNCLQLPEFAGDLMEGGDGDDIFAGMEDQGSEMYGGNGNDLFQGSGGDDLVFGESGNDLLAGDSGDDYLSGGDGNDLLMGDRQVFWLGVDMLQISERFTFTFDAESGWVSSYSPPLHTYFAKDGDEVIIDPALGEWGVKHFTIPAGNDILEGGTGRDFLLGGGGDDILKGDSGADALSGGDGDDILEGGDDNDLLMGDNIDQTGNGADVLFGGAGKDELQGDGGNDQLFGGADDDILFGEDGDDYLAGGDGKDFLYGDNADNTGTGSDTLSGGGGDDQLQGAGGNDVLYGDEGKDTLFGQSGDDQLFGDAGVDQLSGGEGNDWLAGGDDNDQLLGENGNDTLAGGTGSDNLWGGSGDDSLLGGEGDDYLSGGEDNDLLYGEDADDALYGQAGDDELYGGQGDDQLEGGDGNDILHGDTGNDSLTGGGGDDTYLFNLGDEQDTISDTGGMDTLRFGEGITAEDVSIYHLGDSAIFDINGTDDHVTIQWWKAGDTYRIENIQFADGTVWNGDYVQEQLQISPCLYIGSSGRDQMGASSLEATILRGMAGNDWLMGDDANDTLDGGVGNDRLEGHRGDDTYIFNLGYGQEIIYDYGGEDTLRFGEGISEDDISFVRSGRFDVVVAINGASDQVLIEDWGLYSNLQLERIEFIDGTVWDYGAIVAAIGKNIVGTDGPDDLHAWNIEGGVHLLGMGGKDKLRGTSFDDILEGGTGDDSLYGGGDNDTYVFNPGDGKDTITDLGGAQDTIRFGEGINAGDITFNLNTAYDLVLGINGTSDQITIKRPASGTYSPVDIVKFADGTVWDHNFMDGLMPLVGTSGDDKLFAKINTPGILCGLAGNDRLYVKNGNDPLDGGVGDSHINLTGETSCTSRLLSSFNCDIRLSI